MTRFGCRGVVGVSGGGAQRRQRSKGCVRTSAFARGEKGGQFETCTGTQTRDLDARTEAGLDLCNSPGADTTSPGFTIDNFGIQGSFEIPEKKRSMKLPRRVRYDVSLSALLARELVVESAPAVVNMNMRTCFSKVSLEKSFFCQDRVSANGSKSGALPEGTDIHTQRILALVPSSPKMRSMDRKRGLVRPRT